jgi:hypothetical protein
VVVYWLASNGVALGEPAAKADWPKEPVDAKTNLLSWCFGGDLSRSFNNSLSGCFSNSLSRYFYWSFWSFWSFSNNRLNFWCC